YHAKKRGAADSPNVDVKVKGGCARGMQRLSDWYAADDGAGAYAWSDLRHDTVAGATDGAQTGGPATDRLHSHPHPSALEPSHSAWPGLLLTCCSFDAPRRAVYKSNWRTMVI